MENDPVNDDMEFLRRKKLMVEHVGKESGVAEVVRVRCKINSSPPNSLSELWSLIIDSTGRKFLEQNRSKPHSLACFELLLETPLSYPEVCKRYSGYAL